MAGPLHKKTTAPGAVVTPAGTTPAAEDGSLQGEWCGTMNSGIWPHDVWGALIALLLVIVIHLY